MYGSLSSLGNIFLLNVSALNIKLVLLKPELTKEYPKTKEAAPEFSEALISHPK